MKRRKIRRHLEIFENLFYNMADKWRPIVTCPGDSAGVEEMTSVTIGSEQYIYLAFATFCLGQAQCWRSLSIRMEQRSGVNGAKRNIDLEITKGEK